MDTHCDDSVLAILLLQRMNLIGGIRTVDTTLTREVLNEHAAVYRRGSHIGQASAKTSFIVFSTESMVWYFSGFTPLATQLAKYASS